MTTTMTSRSELRREVEDFYYLEADLLDDRRFAEWAELLDEHISYRVEMSRNVHSADRDEQHFSAPLDVCWIDEGHETIMQRIAQFDTGLHWCEEPISRTSHMVTNVRVVDIEETDGHRLVRASSRVLIYRNRNQVTEDWIAARRTDILSSAPDGLRLLERRVQLNQAVLLASNLTTFI